MLGSADSDTGCLTKLTDLLGDVLLESQSPVHILQ